jgi:hypothetical protein
MVFPNRVRDKAGVLSFADQWHFERFLQQIDDESGVDIRFLLVPSVKGEKLEAFSVRMARSMGVGQGLDRRGLLFVYDVSQHRLRVEVGAQMEPIITDAFAGYLMREHVRSFFGTGNPSLGLRTTLFMVQHRLRESVLGRDYDPTFSQFILDTRRLAVGGGASADMQLSEAAFLNQERTSSRAIRTHFSPQPTPEAAFHRYLEWLARGGYATDVPLFTPLSQEYMASLTMTTGFNDHVLMMEYGKSHRVDRRGDLALLYFTTDPLLWPHFLRRTPQGWVIDMWAETLNVRNYSGWWYTWALLDTQDDFATAFADRYTSYGGTLRVRGGDNRPLPVKAYPGIKLQPAPDPGDTLPSANFPQLTVEEAASRIGSSGRALVLIYGTWSQPERAVMPMLAHLAEQCHMKGAEVLAFSMDQDPRALEQLSGVLERSKAPFQALILRQWQPGQLTRAMAPLGIQIPDEWYPPILAVRDGSTGVVVQTIGIDRLMSKAPRLLAACSGKKEE